MLEIKELSLKQGMKVILKDISFNLAAGEISALLGRNGAGKTSLMNCMTQLIRPTSGEVRLDGQHIQRSDFERIAYVPDQTSFLKNYRIKAAIDFMTRYYRRFDTNRAKEFVDLFELSANTKIEQLSKGNQMKVNLLLGLAMNADYLLLDEPFSGMDFIFREELLAAFTDKILAHQSVLISTHDIHEMNYLTDQVIILDEGQILRTFRPEEERLLTGRSIAELLREETR